jgi:4-diphosphocytidyl-2-C-methyl-D-erythritol kinase
VDIHVHQRTVVSALTLQSPAKINLFLAITGRRTDGFHDLVSVVAPLAWGDTLTAEPASDFSLECDYAGVPLDESNLILKAAHAFRIATKTQIAARFALTKRIPIGAGLGGGSSNAVAALRAMNRLAGDPLNQNDLRQIAARLGSDCPLFLEPGPVILRGRGDLVDPLPPTAASRVRGRRILIFKPAFPIPTPWAYAQMAAHPAECYLPPHEAEGRLSTWVDGREPLEKLIWNNMERPAFAKFPALPVLVDHLQQRFGVTARMSGSGSACFALLSEDSPVDDMMAAIRNAWGESATVLQTGLV